MTPILFEEKQRFKMIWLWIILSCTDAFLLYAVFMQIVKGQQFGGKSMSNTSLLIASATSLALTILFLIARLETRISEHEIQVRFFPFHLKFKKYSWDSIYKCFVRKYAPIKEYSGWGIRTGLGGQGKAYTTGGNQGIQLEFTNGSKLLIGTDRQNEVQKILADIPHLPKED